LSSRGVIGAQLNAFWFANDALVQAADEKYLDVAARPLRDDLRRAAARAPQPIPRLLDDDLNSAVANARPDAAIPTNSKPAVE